VDTFSVLTITYLKTTTALDRIIMIINHITDIAGIADVN
jgi:hypothetical protein